MCKILELPSLFVYLEGLVKFFTSVPGGTEKIVGLGLLERGISTQASTMGSPICLEGNVIANSKMYPQ